MKDDKEITFDIDSLRPLAKQRLNTLLEMMSKTGNRELYKEEILKLIEEEKK